MVAPTCFTSALFLSSLFNDVYMFFALLLRKGMINCWSFAKPRSLFRMYFIWSLMMTEAMINPTEMTN